MTLQSCYAGFATSILNSVSFHGFLAHVELEKAAFCCLESSFVAMHGRSKTTTGYMDGF